VFAGLAVDGAIAGMPMGVPPGRLAYVEPGGRLLYLPLDDLRLSIRAMYQSMPDRLSVVNGYAGYVPPHIEVLHWGIERRDPTILRELRRGRPLYVMVDAASDAADVKGFIEAQPGVERLGVTGSGLLYKLAAVPFAPVMATGAPMIIAARSRASGWILLDLGRPATVRSIVMRAAGHIGDLPPSVLVQASDDGVTWRIVYDESPGGTALLASLGDPRTAPMRLVLSGGTARFLRINTPGIDPDGVTVYGRTVSSP
jgi:hypothetical protein